MHCTRLAPELSATSSIERGWIMDSGCAAQDLADPPALLLRQRPGLLDQDAVPDPALVGLVARLLRELLVGEIAPLARLHRRRSSNARPACRARGAVPARAAIRASGCASRTSSRCPSSARPSGTPRAPRPPARPASRR